MSIKVIDAGPDNHLRDIERGDDLKGEYADDEGADEKGEPEVEPASDEDDDDDKGDDYSDEVEHAILENMEGFI
jgi:hypothetical protein